MFLFLNRGIILIIYLYYLVLSDTKANTAISQIGWVRMCMGGSMQVCRYVFSLFPQYDEQFKHD